MGPVYRYVAVVTLAGVALLAVQVGRLAAGEAELRPAQLAVFGLFVVLGELFPIRLPRGDDEEELVTSGPFSYAILLTSGLAAAAAVRAIVSLIPAVAGRKPWWKAGFNASQYIVSLAAGAFVLALLSDVPRPGTPAFTTDDLPAVLASAAVYFLVNNAITGVAVALAQDAHVGEFLRQDLAFRAATSGVMLALAPVVVVSAERSLVLVPLFALPVAAIYSSTTTRLEKHQALHDALTNLPNRRLFRDRVQQAVVAAKRSSPPVAVMILDLDRFKEVNDTLGHHVGDLLLQQVAGRLAGSLREGDTIARLGGDEFALLLPGVTTHDAAEQVAAKIVEALREPFRLKGWTFAIAASIGIALSPEHGDSVDALLQRADVAMYLAKERRGGYEVYSPERDRHSPRRLALLADLREAVDDRALEVHYQPQADMRTGEVTGVEALLRWEHPEHGEVAPAEFVPLAEHTGLIHPLAVFALEEALHQARRWDDAGYVLDVAVNVSVRNLHDGAFVQELQRVLAATAVTPSRLRLEVCERDLMADPARASPALHAVRALGVGVSLDDFGAGATSLGHLKRLAVAEIKIDPSFVSEVASDDHDMTIVRSSVALAHTFGLRVVAEGVESEESWRTLAALGCDAAQGGFLCPPGSAAEVTAWLRAGRGGPRAMAPPDAGVLEGPGGRPARP